MHFVAQSLKREKSQFVTVSQTYSKLLLKRNLNDIN